MVDLEGERTRWDRERSEGSSALLAGTSYYTPDAVEMERMRKEREATEVSGWIGFE